MSGLSEKKNRIIGDIEYRKSFKILVLKREKKNEVLTKVEIFIQDRFLVGVSVC